MAAAGTWAGSSAAGTGGPARTPRTGSAAERTAKKELARLERQIDKLAEREAKLHAELAANATDYVKLTELGDQLRSAADEKSALEERWLEVAADLG